MVNPGGDPSSKTKNVARTGSVLAVTLASGPLEDLLKPLAGQPLLAYSLTASLQSRAIGKVIVAGDAELVARSSQIRRDLDLPADKVSFLSFQEPGLAADTTDLLQYKEVRQRLLHLAGDDFGIIALLDPHWPLYPDGVLDEAADLLAGHEQDVKIVSVSAEPKGQYWWALPGKEALVAATGPDGSQLYAQTGHFEFFSPVKIDESRRAIPFILGPDYNLRVGGQQNWERADWLLQYSRLKIAYPGHNRRPLPERVTLLVMDFDGVLTDNRVWVSEEGHEMVAANRSDSLGMGILRKGGIEPMVLSMETNPVVAARCRKMKVPVLQGINDKAPVLAHYLAEKGIDPGQVVYVGNDVNDLPCFPLVGCAVAVADAQPAVLRQADLVLSRNGGHAAVRELCDLLVSRANRNE